VHSWSEMYILLQTNCQGVMAMRATRIYWNMSVTILSRQILLYFLFGCELWYLYIGWLHFSSCLVLSSETKWRFIYFFIYLCSPTSGPRPAAHLYSLAFYKCSRTRQIMTRKHEFVAFNQLNHIISGRDVIMKNLPRTVILMAVIDSFDIDISIHILKYRYIGVKQI